MLTKTMGEKYWDRTALDYDNKILDVVANDRKQIVIKHINKFASKQSKESIAFDFGCGTGKNLPILAKIFGTVYAIDISRNCLQFGQEACSHLDNIIYVKTDLSNNGAKLGKAHFGLCINVIIMPCFEKRMGIFKTISGHIFRGGHFLLVVPSLESALYSNLQLIQMNMKDGASYARASASGLSSESAADVSIPDGILNLDGVLTKHYLKQELLVLLRGLRFRVISIEEIEYPWKTEFIDPPRWMKEPYPWDWLVVSQKI